MGFIYPEKEKRNKEQNLKVRVLSKALKSSGSDSPVCFFFGCSGVFQKSKAAGHFVETPDISGVVFSSTQS